VGTTYSARELKSVHVRVPCLLLRLVVHKCHVNGHNTANQVGLVAINILGEALPQDAPGSGVPAGPLTVATSAGAALPSGVQPAGEEDPVFDATTTALLAQLAQAKAAAVAAEDYDEAKRLRDAYAAARAVALQRAALEQRKAAAIAVEDYDAAKALKQEMQLLDEAGGAATAAAAAKAGIRVPSQRHVIIPDSPASGPVRVGPPTPRRSALGRPSSSSAVPDREAPTVQLLPVPKAGAYSSYDDRPAVSRARAGGGFMDEGDGEGMDGGADESTPASPKPARGAAARAAAGGRGGTLTSSGVGRLPHTQHRAEDPVGAAPGAEPATPHDPATEGFSPDLPVAEPLSAADAKDAGPLAPYVGEYTVMALCSKNWALRDAAVSRMETLLSSGQALSSRDDGATADTLPADAVRALARAVARTLRDKVAAVALGGGRLLKALLARPDLAATVLRDSKDAVADVLGALVERAGDANGRLHACAQECLLALAKHPGCGVAVVSAPLLRPPKNMGAAKPLLGRMAVLEALVEAHKGAISVETAMPLLGKCLESPLGEVRTAALKGCASLAAAANARPESLLRTLPKTLKQNMRDAVTEALGLPLAPPPSRSSALPPGLATGGAKAPGLGSTAKSATAKAPASPAKPKPAAPPGPAQVAAPSASRAIVALTNELRSKEREFGMSHPEVAVLLTDLAALYSEEEQFSSAQPLYERALRIQENVLGGEHPDTVQTLTDLAICHLDQGANDQGRPLLERALALQEAALGPDHPDVAAVRDVLASLDAEAQAAPI
jgi:centrosomal protein CEP104